MNYTSQQNLIGLRNQQIDSKFQSDPDLYKVKIMYKSTLGVQK